MELKNRDFININQIPESDIDMITNICFTFTIPALTTFDYKTNKGIKRRRQFKTFSWKVQCDILSRDMPLEWNRYYEQHLDGRYHLHGFARTTVREFRMYQLKQFESIRCKKQDVQDYLFLAEILKDNCEPQWIKYCTKEQDSYLTKDILDKLACSLTPTPIVKIETNERDFTKYQFGQNKKFLVEL